MNITRDPIAPGNYRVGRERHLQSGEIEAYRPEAIVIHLEDGTERGTDAWFDDPGSHVSAHYSVSKAGEVRQFVDEADTAFACGVVDRPAWPLLKTGVNPNLYTISIENEGAGDEPWPEAQVSALARLVADVAGRNDIAVDALHVVPHHAIRASKSCPGKGIDIGRLITQAVLCSTSSTPPSSAS